MLYLHFCGNCDRIHILSGHRTLCPACDTQLTELKTPYVTYIGWNVSQREDFMEKCRNPLSLQKISTVYAMRKYHPRNE